MRRRRFLNLACWGLESCAEELGDAGEGMEAPLQQGPKVFGFQLPGHFKRRI